MLPAVRGLERTDDALLVVFDRSSAEIVTAFVAAEQLCCASITWDLASQPALCLSIAATPAQLDVLHDLFTTPDGFPDSDTIAT
ncbi:MAG: hypothetical protein ACYDCQ_06560 [Dehalococcoidia bacterium]